MHYRCLLLPLLVVLSGCTTTPGHLTHRQHPLSARSSQSTQKKSAHCRKTRFHNQHRHHAPHHHQPTQHNSTFPV